MIIITTMTTYLLGHIKYAVVNHFFVWHWLFFLGYPYLGCKPLTPNWWNSHKPTQQCIKLRDKVDQPYTLPSS